jgi:DNA-binding transcriptional LysR family regulator
MDASDLRVFETVARLGGMNRAAAALNTVQSNVTARIRALEQELGTALFSRHARGVALTRAGERLLPYAARVARLLIEARQAAQDDGTPRGTLTIGSLETTAALRLSPMLARYAASYPEVDLVLRTGTTCELIAQVRDRTLEGAFVCGPVADPDLVVQPVFREELVLVAPPGAQRLEDTVRGGEMRIVVLRAGCSYRARLETILAQHGATKTRLLEFGTIEALLGCVAAGLGVTLLPRGIAEPARREGRVAICPLPPHEAAVETLFVRLRDGFVSSALAAFLAFAHPAALRADAAD